MPCTSAAGESLGESFDSPHAELRRADSHVLKYTVTHHPFTGILALAVVDDWDEWVTDQAHSRKEMFQNDIFKSAVRHPWELECLGK